jgi:hypothetical protein
MTMNETEFEREARMRTPRGRNYIAADEITQPDPTDVYIGQVTRSRNSPLFEGGDIAAAVLASAMMLGPLAAYAVGWGA